MYYRSQRLFQDIVLWAVTIQLTGLCFGATMVTRPGASDDECEKLCRDEAEIDCNFYDYDSDKNLCVLTTEPDPTFPELKKLDEPVSDKPSAESWVTQLQARVLALEQKDTDTANLHKSISELKIEIEGLKSSQILTNNLVKTNKEQADQSIAAIDDKVELVEGDVKRLEDTIQTMGDMQKTLGNKIRQLNEDLKATSLTVTMISQTTKDQRGTLREVGASINEVRTGISDVKKSVTDLQVRFAGLSTDVMEKVANVDAMVGPELRDLKFSQTTLAQALGLLTKKIMMISPRIPELQKRISAKEVKFTAIDIQIQSLGRQISVFSDRMSFSEGQVKRIVDPASRLNLERRQTLMHVQSQVDSLVIAQTRLQNDLLAEVSDRGRIYKELSGLKLDKKSMLDQIINQDEQMRDIKKAVKILIADEPKSKLVSNLLSRQLAVLRSLKRMQDMQDDQKNSFARYKANVEVAHRGLWQQIEGRRATDRSLIKMQSKLFSAYRRMRAFMEEDDTKEVVRSLISRHNDAVKRINSMRLLQQYMSETMIQNRWVVKKLQLNLHSLEDSRDKDLLQMASIKRSIAEVYKVVVRYKLAREAEDIPGAIQRLTKLTEKQNEIAASFTQHKADFQRIQSEVIVQRKKHLKQAFKTVIVLQRLQAMEKAIALLNNREKQYYAKLDEVQNTLQEQIQIQAKQTLSKISSSALMNDIRIAVADEVDKQNKRRDSQMVSRTTFVNDIRNAVSQEVEKQRRRDHQTPNMATVDIENQNKLQLLKQQQIENAHLRREIQVKQELLDVMNKRRNHST